MSTMNKTNLRRNRLLNNTALLAVGTIFTKGISLVMVVLYSRWLSAGAYGDFELYVTYLSLLLPVATLSCGEAVFRLLLDKEVLKERKQIISTALMISAIGVILSITLLFLLGRTLFTDNFIEFVVLFALETIFNISQYCSRGLHQLKYYTIASAINAVVMAITTTVFICLLHLDLKGLLYGHICGYLCATVFVTSKLKLYKYISLMDFSTAEARQIIQYSAPLIPNSIAWWIANGSDRTFIRIYLGSDFNGIYSIANKVPALCITLFNVFHLSWQESASDALKEDENAESYFNQIFSGLIPPLFSIAITVLSSNFLLFQYIFDPKYADGYLHVAILTTATVLSFMSQFIGGIFIGLKKTSVNGITTMLAAGINIVIDFAFIRQIGLYAASISTLVAYAVLFIVRFCIVRKYYRLHFTNKSFFYIALFLYYAAAQYINNSYLNYVNFLLSIVILLITNKNYIVLLVDKLLRRKTVNKKNMQD